MSAAALEIPDSVLSDVVALRRDFHAHPELGFEEVRTAGIVAERLKGLGYEVRTGVGLTGVVGILRSGKPGRTILLRADMDALPIDERSGVDFASIVPGKMHACGHDGHVAMLLGAAQLIAERRDVLCGTIVLCFQPAEEGLGGARAMVEDGVLEDPYVERVYGLHLWSLSPSGVVSTRAGPIMASGDSLEIKVRGRGGHGAGPHQAVDPIVTAASFVSQVQTVVSRRIDPLEPAVVTIGAIHGGTTHNVIPDEVSLLGTVRAFSPDVRDALEASIETVLKGCCEAHAATYEYKYVRRYPVTSNEPQQTAYVMKLAEATLGPGRAVGMEPVMGAEDFSFMLQKRPGCFFFVGVQRDERTAVPHHNARFAIDEAALGSGLRMMLALALDAPRQP